MNEPVRMEAILRRLDTERVTALSPEELVELLEVGLLVSEDDTHLSGPIRVIEVAGKVLVQERSGREELLLRQVEDRDAARRFVARRLEAYERMWDG